MICMNNVSHRKIQVTSKKIFAYEGLYFGLLCVAHVPFPNAFWVLQEGILMLSVEISGHGLPV